MLYLFYILSKTDRSEVQIDSKEGYLTLWCHQPNPGQSLNPQTVVEFGDQEVESVWIFQRVLTLVARKHSCKLDYQDKFSVLKHSLLTVFCVCFSKIIRTRQKNKRGDSKVESNDSPEIPDRGETSDIPGLPSGVST